MRRLPIIILLLLSLPILYLGLAKSSSVRTYLPSLLTNDKHLHTLIFAIISFILFFVFDSPNRARNGVITGLVMAVAGVGSEVVQGLSPVSVL